MSRAAFVAGILLFALRAQAGTGWIPQGGDTSDPNRVMECGGLANPRKTLLDTMLFTRASEIDDIEKRHKLLSGYAAMPEISESDLMAFFQRMTSDVYLPMNVSDSGGMWALVKAYVADPLRSADVKVVCKTTHVDAFRVGTVGIQRIIFPSISKNGASEQLIVDETYICSPSCKRAAVNVDHLVATKAARSGTSMWSGDVWDLGFWPPLSGPNRYERPVRKR